MLFLSFFQPGSDDKKPPAPRLVWNQCMNLHLLLEVRAQRPHGKERSASTRCWDNVAASVVSATAAEENVTVVISRCTAHEHCDLLLTQYAKE